MGIRVVGTGPSTRTTTSGVAIVGQQMNEGPGTRPIPAPPIQIKWTKCHANTKTGTPCKAHPALGTKYCVGHLKVYGE